MTIIRHKGFTCLCVFVYLSLNLHVIVECLVSSYTYILICLWYISVCLCVCVGGNPLFLVAHVCVFYSCALSVCACMYAFVCSLFLSYMCAVCMTVFNYIIISSISLVCGLCASASCWLGLALHLSSLAEIYEVTGGDMEEVWAGLKARYKEK